MAFVSDREGQFDAWWGLIKGGSYGNLTDGSHSVWSLKIRDSQFDLDSTHLLLSGDKDSWITQVELVSEEQRQSTLGKGVGNVSWSPDGERMAFHLSTDGDPLYVADADGQNREQITFLEEGMHQHYPSWSFDGEWIYIVRGIPGTRDMDLWRISPDGLTEEQLTSDKVDVGYPAPIDNETVLFVAGDLVGGGPWLWALDLESRDVQRAGIGVEAYLSIAASLDGRTLVATVANPVPRLQRIPIQPGNEMTGKDRRAIP